ncbi:hypothetical protein B296_00044698 [Ensete ventricosum]|uniref:Uncharacterized protein n=1 Tax=Ensete ventricosum TaxID=4639 RepID=A0A426XJK0_ENSVE|nr:hypothetical protein B296_00044698 [Ensete ventricosum]
MGSRTSTIFQKNAIFVNFAQSHARIEFRSVFRATSRKFDILAIPNVLAYGKWYEPNFVKKCYGHKVSQSYARSQVLIGFLCTVSEIQNSGNSKGSSSLEVVRPWFYEKYDGHKLCAKYHVDRVLIDFSCTISKIQNTGHSQRISPREVIRAWFCERYDGHKFFRATSRKLKLLAIPNVLAHEKSYEHGFAKKHDGHKLCTKLHTKPSFDRFITYPLRNSK